jgi:hypothetical protein
MKTHKLVIAALVTGMAILVAGGIFFVQLLRMQ